MKKNLLTKIHLQLYVYHELNFTVFILKSMIKMNLKKYDITYENLWLFYDVLL